MRTCLFAFVALFAACAPERRGVHSNPAPDIGDIGAPLDMQDLEQQRPENYDPPSHQRLDPERNGDSSSSDFIR